MRLWPWLRTCWARARPNPFEVPVIRKVVGVDIAGARYSDSCLGNPLWVSKTYEVLKSRPLYLDSEVGVNGGTLVLIYPSSVLPQTSQIFRAFRTLVDIGGV